MRCVSSHSAFNYRDGAHVGSAFAALVAFARVVNVCPRVPTSPYAVQHVVQGHYLGVVIFGVADRRKSDTMRRG